MHQREKRPPQPKLSCCVDYLTLFAHGKPALTDLGDVKLLYLRGNVLGEIWLNIPQAVVLEATGDLEQARGLARGDPRLLVYKAAHLLPLGTVPMEPDASPEVMQTALRKLREEIGPRSSQRSYNVSLGKVHDKLINGVTTKGRRAPNLPVEVIDPAEFVCLELDGLNAVDPGTGRAVWYGLLIDAQELIEGSGQPSGRELRPVSDKLDRSEQIETEVLPSTASRTAEIGSSTKPAGPISDRDLRSWYEQRVSELMACGGASSGDADWEAARRQFPRQITRSRLRQVREQFAPTGWKKQGRRSPRTAK
jgi:hypothetical protein